MSPFLDRLRTHKPCENLAEMHKKADIESQAWAFFLEAWYAKLGDKEYCTAKELIELWKADSDLAETLPDPIATWFQDDAKTIKNKVGKLLAKKTGRPYGTNNLRIVKSEDSHAKIAAFKVAGYAGYAGYNSSLYEAKKSSSSQGSNTYKSDIEHEAKDTTQTPQTPQNVPQSVASDMAVKGFLHSFLSQSGQALTVRDKDIVIGVPETVSDEEYQRIKVFVDEHQDEIQVFLRTYNQGQAQS